MRFAEGPHTAQGEEFDKVGGSVAPAAASDPNLLNQGAELTGLRQGQLLLPNAQSGIPAAGFSKEGRPRRRYSRMAASTPGGATR